MSRLNIPVFAPCRFSVLGNNLIFRLTKDAKVMPAEGEEVEYGPPITLLANTHTMHKVILPIQLLCSNLARVISMSFQHIQITLFCCHAFHFVLCLQKSSSFNTVAVSKSSVIRKRVRLLQPYTIQVEVELVGTPSHFATASTKDAERVLLKVTDSSGEESVGAWRQACDLLRKLKVKKGTLL
jgi:hypothetical protein